MTFGTHAKNQWNFDYLKGGPAFSGWAFQLKMWFEIASQRDKKRQVLVKSRGWLGSLVAVNSLEKVAFPSGPSKNAVRPRKPRTRLLHLVMV